MAGKIAVGIQSFDTLIEKQYYRPVDYRFVSEILLCKSCCRYDGSRQGVL